MKKICPDCKKKQKLSCFAFKNKAEGTRQPYCDTCRKLRAKESYSRNKKTVIQASMARQQIVRNRYYEYKKTQHCLLCNENASCCLTFHHLDPKTKDTEVSLLLNYSWNRILKEIQKCVCLCANCHAKVHAGLVKLPS